LPSVSGEMVQKSVLVVDAHRDMLDALGRLLAEEGFAAHGAHSADLALALLDAGLHPDIVVADIEMPGLGCADLAALLAVGQPLRHVPVVLFSASPAAARCAREIGAAGWVAKPNHHRLLELVRHLA
jgi:CheY-like chemotaxis protein